MSLSEKLRESVREVEKNGLAYALAGGLVASLYRREPRATADVDLVVLTEDESLAESVLRALGLDPVSLRKANLEGGPLFAIKKKNTPVFIVCGRNPRDPEAVGVDLILARIPWAKTALERALANRIDFGFGGIPCLTLEDFVLSKFYSVRNQSTRFMDLDDLRSIFESGNGIDWDYVRDRMRALDFDVPESIVELLPPGTRLR